MEQQNLEDLKKRFELVKKSFDRQGKQKELERLQAQSSQPGFWQDHQNAAKVMQKIARLSEEISAYDDLQKNLEAKKLEKLETAMFLSGPHDANFAILSIHAGQGGVEAMDWTAMLSRMYQKYFSNKKWPHDILDETPGEEAGFKTVTIYVKSQNAYGHLKNESGVHRLVRQSPFNAAHLRQTSFALVEVIPAVQEAEEIEIRPEDIEIEAFRSGGNGGQNDNKDSIAVSFRQTHI